MQNKTTSHSSQNDYPRKQTGSVAPVVEYLQSKHKTLGSIPSMREREREQQMLMKMWGKGNLYTMLVGM
jgi:hypothetical protein